MKYCTNCGAQLSDDARFCSVCGAAVAMQPPKKRVEQAGTVYKCPTCGEVLGGFVAICPACGYEVRNAKASDSVKDFANQLAAIEAEEMPTNESHSILKKILGRDLRETPKRLEEAQREFNQQKQARKISLITNYPIPNTKEDLAEFTLLVRSNLQDTSNNEVFFAWVAKLEQLYQKAKLLIPSDTVFNTIQALYFQYKRKARQKKQLPFYLSALSFGLIFLMCGFTYKPTLTIVILAVVFIIAIVGYIIQKRKEQI